MARVRVACREAASFREPRAALSAAVDMAARGRRGKGEGEEEVRARRSREETADPERLSFQGPGLVQFWELVQLTISIN